MRAPSLRRATALTALILILILILILTACASSGADGAARDDAAADSSETSGSVPNEAADHATLTIGEETWEFDNFFCAFGYENTSSDVFSFTSDSRGEFDGADLQMQVTIADESGQGRFAGADVVHHIGIDDVSDFENPSVDFSMGGTDLVRIDGAVVTAEGNFDDGRTTEREQLPGRLEATCSHAAPASAGRASGDDGDGGDNGDPPDDPGVSTDAPFAVTVDGRTFGYTDGRCSATTDEVHAEADDASFNGMRVDWRADDPNETRIIMQTPPPVMVLQAGPDFPDTTLEVTVDGSQVEVSARMLDQLSNQFKDVVIRLDCSQEVFGPEPEVAGTATVEVGGETYVLDALDTCRITDEGVHVDKLAGEDGIAFSVAPDPGPGHTVALYLPDGGWVGGPGFIRDQPGVEFEVSGQRATWSGALTPLIGDEQPAGIMIECG